MFFVTDCQKCFNSNSELSLLLETINNIIETIKFSNKNIELIIIINKIDKLNYNLNEINLLINNCKLIINKYLILNINNNNLIYYYKLMITFQPICSLNLLVYRMFRCDKSFKRMNQSQINYLCKLEFEKSIKINTNNIKYYCNQLNERLVNNSNDWIENCCFHSFLNTISLKLTKVSNILFIFQ